MIRSSIPPKMPDAWHLIGLEVENVAPPCLTRNFVFTKQRMHIQRLINDRMDCLSKTLFILFIRILTKCRQLSPTKYSLHGLRATANPILALFSSALVSISPEIVTRDFGRHWCCIRALALP